MVKIVASHYLLGDKKESLKNLCDLNPSWDYDRLLLKTGIKNRHILGPNQSPEKLSIEAGKKCISSLKNDEIDGIIYVSQSPSQPLPTRACLLQTELNLKKDCLAFDINQGCSGFVYAFVTASQFIHSSAHRRVMVIGADKMSSILDMTDRNTCVLFGDGAGGVILDRSENSSNGLIDFLHCADGSDTDSLNVLGGGSLNPSSHGTVDNGLHFVRQDGRLVFKFAVRKMAEVSADLLDRNGLSGQDLKLFIPHQANLRIIDSAAEKLKLSPEKILVNIEKYANTTAATIPIALSQACDEKRLQAKDLLLMTGVGAGLTWGSVLYRWGENCE